MLTKLIHVLEHLTGVLLCGLGVGVQISNLMVCIFMIWLGPSFIIKLVAQ
jgi:hypothetical protein